MSLVSIVIMMAVAAAVSTLISLRDRAGRLPTAAQRPTLGAAHQRHRRIVLSAVHVPRILRLAASTRTQASPSWSENVDLGIISLKWVEVLVIGAAMVMMSTLYLFVMRTRTGTAIRAVSEDQSTAALMGIDVNRAIVTTFALGAAMAGAAGVLYALLFRQVDFYVGFVPGIKAFTAAVLGGIGNIPGAMLGGLFLGEIEAVGPTLFFSGLGVPSVNQLKDVIAFTMLVLVLVFRPQGILGERLARQRA